MRGVAEPPIVNFPASFRTLVSRVVPGVTGLWQVSARSNGDVAAEEMGDPYYICNWPLWLGLYILVHTILVHTGESIIMAKGAY